MPLASIRGTNIHYREVGAGPLALFVHGFPFDHGMWLHQLGATAHLRRAVAPDLRGFGRSERTFAEALTMERHADDMAALIESLGEERADVIGLSMGGYVALAMWERHPGTVRSLVLADTRARADTPEGKINRDRSAAQLVAEGKSRWGGLMIEALVAAKARTEVRARLRTMIDHTGYEGIVAALAGMRDRADRTGLLAGITVPTLVVAGARDRLTLPEEAEAMAAAIPGARFALVPDAGHVPPVEAPEAFNEALVAFLEDIDT